MKVGFLASLTLIFITLKLLDAITWSWFWVLSPIILGYPLLLVIAFVAIAVSIWISERK